MVVSQKKKYLQVLLFDILLNVLLKNNAEEMGMSRKDALQQYIWLYSQESSVLKYHKHSETRFVQLR